ncbi:MAG: hypothetical protein Q4Q58_06785 [Thermoplasmata archaeon]|nr:hypothetical protein [Thermoplasmata archaeon]
MVVQEQPHAEGCGPVTLNVTTDEETDRMLSLRASSRVPLPREIALCDERDARPYHEWVGYYETFGLADHPLVRLVGRHMLDAAMASALSRAEHLDRVAHYAAWLGVEGVRIVDLVGPTRDDPAAAPGASQRPAAPPVVPQPPADRPCPPAPRPRSGRRRTNRPRGRVAARQRPPAVFPWGGCPQNEIT